MQKNKLPIISIIGPTCMGKSSLALELHNQYPVEIISVDSVMIYKDLNIGTDKPDENILSRIKHNLVNIKNPDETFSVGEFLNITNKLIQQIHDKKKIPLLVGGTSMYFNQLFNGLNNLPEKSSQERSFIDFLAKKYGWVALYKVLSHIDSEFTARVEKNDKQRIQRALEVYLLSGKPLSSFFVNSKRLENKYKLVTFKLFSSNRKTLHDLIEKRTNKMFKKGFIDEVELIKKNYPISSNSQSMRSIGYSHILRFLDNEINYDELIETCIYSTRQLAKRQITWLKKFKDGIEIDTISSDRNKVLGIINKNLHFL